MINTIGAPDPGDAGFTELLFAFGSQGKLRLLQDTNSLTTWEVTDYRKDIKVRCAKIAWKITKWK